MEREDFPGRNACGIGLGDGTVVDIPVAAKSVFRVHEDKFDEIRKQFVELNGVYERRFGCVDDGISHVGQH